MFDPNAARAFAAGVEYFAWVFAAGFVFGVVRTLGLAPRLGEFGAVAIELPLILALAWVACAWIVRRRAISARIGARLVMGLTAFGVLMLAELAISLIGFDRSVAEHLALYRRPPAQIGVLGQALFAAFPALQSLRRLRR